MKHLLCLHGWGGSNESFTELREALQGRNDIVMHTPDLPGFGNEPEPDKAWTTEDYADWVTHYVQQHIDGPFLLLGHSHGGRISIVLAARNKLPIEHLYLCAAAGLPQKRYLKRYIGYAIAKVGNAVFSLPLLKQCKALAKKVLYKLLRVHDYERASPRMKETMVLVTKTNVRPLLSTITIPVDLFWGTEDTMTPYSDGKLMEQKLPNATLHTFKGVRHAVHRAGAKTIANCI